MSVMDAEIRPLTVPPPRRVVDLTMSDGAVIRLRQYGRTGGKRLALSHGNGLAINAYLPFWLPLADEFDLILFDVRNHGENPLHEPAAHNWDRFARDMSEIFTGINDTFDKADRRRLSFALRGGRAAACGECPSAMVGARAVRSAALSATRPPAAAARAGRHG